MNKPLNPRQLIQIEEHGPPYTPIPGTHLQVTQSGLSVTVAGATAIGGYIVNPATPEEQGQDTLHELYVSVAGPASTFASDTTVAIAPGDYYVFPRYNTFGVWVNSKVNHHLFTAVQIVPQSLITPTQDELDDKYIKGAFPPTGPTGVTKSIHSYLYQEYSLDSDLQGFVKAYNDMQQDIVDTFNGLNLPNYTQEPISGALLDWVARGIYGMPRPSISSGKYATEGPYNTIEYNTFEYNHYKLLYPDPLSITSDDIFRRILTWHISKQDGKYFSIPWLKKRVMRFLIGENGKHPDIDEHYQISVTFGPNYECTIRFVLYIRTVTGGAVYNSDNFTYNNIQYNQLDSTLTSLPALPTMEIFKEAVASGALELPFQYKFDVVIG